MTLLENSRDFLENEMRFYAYDSFKGLPKVETDHNSAQSGMSVLYQLLENNLRNLSQNQD